MINPEQNFGLNPLLFRKVSTLIFNSYWRYLRHSRREMFTPGGISKSPIASDTAAWPLEIPLGILTFIWITPAGSPGAAPQYVTSAGTPPILAATGIAVADAIPGCPSPA